MVGYARVTAILDNSIGGPQAQIGAHGAFWRGLSRDQFINKSVFGLKLIELGDSASSNLIKALKGQNPFDDSTFPRMPVGRPAVPADQIAEIAAWIDAGAPEIAAGVAEIAARERPLLAAVAVAPQAAGATTGGGRFFLGTSFLPTALSGAGAEDASGDVIYRIHPAIGIARVGNSERGYFLAPEVPDTVPILNDPEFSSPPNNRFKTASGTIKRQGARFRVYEYQKQGNGYVPTREITHSLAEIEWKVILGNRKAYGPKIFVKGNRNPGLPESRLVIESQEASIASGSSQWVGLQGHFQANHTHKVAVPLGDIFVDPNGRLIVLGGKGESFSPTNAPQQDTFNNDGWCDDTSDGRVTAKIKVRATGKEYPISEPAWVIVGPPDYAPPIGNVVSLFDVVYDVCAEKFKEQFDPILKAGRVSFAHHVFPLLKRATDVFWVDRSAQQSGTGLGHGPNGSANFLDPIMLALLSDNSQNQGSNAWRIRQGVFAKLRKPDGSGGDMPMLQPELDTGRLPSVTSTVYEIMRKWAAGQFDSDWNPSQMPKKLTDVAVAEQPFALDKAALDTCLGASFYPGIEAPRILRDRASLYYRPFRIHPNTQPGFITRDLALPWQTDFFACENAWWPAQRPNQVHLPPSRPGEYVEWAEGVSGENFDINFWKFMGYVKAAEAGAAAYVEDERDWPRQAFF